MIKYSNDQRASLILRQRPFGLEQMIKVSYDHLKL